MKSLSPQRSRPQVFPWWAAPAAPHQRAVGRRGSPDGSVGRERGVALVVTLIMLAVVTFMAVVFLAVSRRERVAVAASIEYNDARLMADAAFARAQADVLTRLLARSNLFSFDVLVSTNYFSPRGFNPNGSARAAFTNVNYDYRIDGSRLSEADRIQNIANLLYDPRPPVFVSTNGASSPLDFRFYLDLNRNGRFESNGWLPIINQRGMFVDSNGVERTPTFPPPPGLLSNFFVGDPEWIGVLEHPDAPHSDTNRFVGRIAYLVVPEGKTLDLNFIHNNAKRLAPDVAGYFRNQGVGPWEINLAAFLRDLNTNAWAGPQLAYDYRPEPTIASPGVAFADALALLNQRYNGTYGNLFRFGTLLPAVQFSLASDVVDIYSDGPLYTGIGAPLNDDALPKLNAAPWPGSDNPQTFFSPQELFSNTNGNPSLTALAGRLLSLGTIGSPYDASTYDRYTYYRLVGQLGLDSAPALTHRLYFAYPEIGASAEIVTNKINLNWRSQARPGEDPSPQFATNFFAWEPREFFLVTADRLLRGGMFTITNPPEVPLNRRYLHGVADTLVRTNLSITNLQIWYNGPSAPAGYIYTNREYTASVHRLLQLAANIYDATVRNAGEGSSSGIPRPLSPTVPYYPSVFRPRFRNNGTNIVIFDYAEVLPADTAAQLARPWRDLDNPNDRAALQPDDNVYGIPWVIGAKKGYPNFNEFSLQTFMQLTRKAEVTKPSPADRNPRSWATNQLYLLGISNVFGVEAWNSYSNTLPQGYPRPLEMRVECDFTLLLLTNTNAPLNPILSVTNRVRTATNLPAQAWRPLQFQIPVWTNFISLRESGYYFSRPNRPLEPSETAVFPVNEFFQVPTFSLLVSNSLRYVLIDRQANGGQIVDFVNLTGLTNLIDVTSELIGRVDAGEASAPGQMWLTNRFGGVNDVRVPTLGILNQMLGSLGLAVLGGDRLSEADWSDYNGQLVNDREKAIDRFRVFLGLAPLTYPVQTLRNELGASTRQQAPFAPTRKLYAYTTWQANDPLVHYMAEDLVDPLRTNLVRLVVPPNLPLSTNENLGMLNLRYRPWGGYPLKDTASDTNAYNVAVKDGLVRQSDDWNFPTNKFPNIGWLGRVHRGTPWQTIYLKAPVIDTNAWFQWAGHYGSHPTNDWRILDYFTVAPYENAARGLLGVNQTNLAAWSAVLSGVAVLTNNADDTALLGRTEPAYAPLLIQPAGAYNPFAPQKPPVAQIVEGINRTRASLTNFGSQFPYLGMVLATPELTVASPFLNTSTNQVRFGLSDEAYERIPQQILSLLKTDEPRFTVYAFGQSLKPAPRSIVLSGEFQGLCTNYQVTGEFATKTVVRLEGELNKNLRAVIESYKVLPPD